VQDTVNAIYNTTKSVTVHAGGSFTVSAAASLPVNIKSNSGPALLIDFTPVTKGSVTYYGSGTTTAGASSGTDLGFGTISMPLNLIERLRFKEVSRSSAIPRWALGSWSVGWHRDQSWHGDARIRHR